MTELAPTLPVMALPALDPSDARINMEAPAGLTIAEIVDLALPGMTPEMRKRCRVSLIKGTNVQVIPADIWHLSRPREGVQVIVRVIPGRNALRTILTVVVAIAAVAAGNILAPGLAGALGISTATATSLIGLGVTTIGNLLINALIPPVSPTAQTREAENRYTIQGWRNRLEPGGAVPQVTGTIRYAPPFAAYSYSEIVGDFQYVRALFCYGYGALELSDHRIGDTSLEDYDEVEIEVRDGLVTDQPVSLMPQQVVEEQVGVPLERPFPRDDLGNVIEGSEPEEEPKTRPTGANAQGASVLLHFPSGLIRFNDDGGTAPLTVSIRIEQREVGTEDWTVVTNLDISGAKLESFFRQHTWQFPTRGYWEVRLIRLTPENLDHRQQMDVNWAALQTLRPEYPLNFEHPLSLVALRVKATAQINGQLDNFNSLVRLICLDWDVDQQAWVMRATRNPASIYRHLLQSPANVKPVTDAQIDLDMLQSWHEFCSDKGLAFNHVFDQADTTLRDNLQAVALAGRASPRHDGVRWTVTIDRPQTFIMDELSPRNSSDFEIKRPYVEPPDGYRVRFLDETNDYKPDDRYVPWPGHEGDILVTEELKLPGKTNPDEIYIEARRRMLEVIHRPNIYYAVQDGAARTSGRGDQVAVSHTVLGEAQTSGRVQEVKGRLIELDELVTVEDDKSYGISFTSVEIQHDEAGEPVDYETTHNTSRVSARVSETTVLEIAPGDAVPAIGDLVLFGQMENVASSLIVLDVESGNDMSGRYRMTDAAPIIDELVDALEVPEWSGIVGAELAANMTAPSAPQFLGISTATGDAADLDHVNFLIGPGSGNVPVSEFVVQYRLTGDADWMSVTIPAANGGGSIDVFAEGDAIELRGFARSYANVDGPASGVVSFVVGEDADPRPAPIDEDTIALIGNLGGVSIQFALGDDANVASVQVYRSTVDVLDRDADAIGTPLSVQPNGTATAQVGDLTRQNLLQGKDIVAGDGWVVSGNVASHSSGNAGALEIACPIEADRIYRIGYVVSDVQSGSVSVALAGGVDQVGASVAADGSHAERLSSVVGTDRVEWRATGDFAGSVAGLIAYLETAACLTQGRHYFWLEPQNGQGFAGHVSGPFAVDIV
ncbi:host specificity factor TipJ family phage tail protein [uncultured Tateyamaria sp.]|uniref:host specificity factor TipJ family phage tail protein n=1 Tax=uncultured Tateyamaria sp. TaxID=455651 RepID=UPI00260EF4D4|nr:host specificity factor TipJ family phage tail protein [uncultured Tateyamaria sp.]